MIQIITNNYDIQQIYKDNKEYETNGFDKPDSFDEYKINIIDLNIESLWQDKGGNKDTINNISVIKHFKKILESSIWKKNLTKQGKNYLLLVIYHTILQGIYFSNYSKMPNISKVLSSLFRKK